MACVRPLAFNAYSYKNVESILKNGLDQQPLVSASPQTRLPLLEHENLQGFRTLYIRSPHFFYQIALARADGSYGTLMKRFSKTHLPAIDDLGLAPSRVRNEETCLKSSKTVMDQVPP